MSVLKIGFLAALLSWLPGCGRQVVEFKTEDAGVDSGSGGAAPAVTSTVPVNGALAVARDTAIWRSLPPSARRWIRRRSPGSRSP